MKRFIKKCLVCILAVLCVAGMGLTALGASECFLTFSLMDKTKGAFTDDVIITMTNTDASTKLKYEYTMRSGDYLSDITICGNVKYGKYTIALKYASNSDFVILNTDGTAIGDFTADSTEHTFAWTVKSISDEPSTKPGDNASDKVTGTSATDTSIAEGKELWDAFVESVSVFDTEPDSYATIHTVFGNTSKVLLDFYVEICHRAGLEKTADDFNAMPFVERYLWKVSYLSPTHSLEHAGSLLYEHTKTLDMWNAKIASVGRYGHDEMLINSGAEVQAEAYKALMEWQYYYYIDNGVLYNFLMSSETDVSSSPSAEKPEETATTSPTVTPTPSPSPTPAPSIAPSEEPNTGIWGGVGTLLKDNIITIVIILVLLAAVIGVILYRRSKAVDKE